MNTKLLQQLGQGILDNIRCMPTPTPTLVAIQAIRLEVAEEYMYLLNTLPADQPVGNSGLTNQELEETFPTYVE